MTKPKAPPPPPAPNLAKSGGKAPSTVIPASVALDIESGPKAGAERIVIYGTGGIGKSTLAAWLPRPLFVDVEDGTRQLDVARISARSWMDLRGKLATMAASPPQGFESIVIDTVTQVEELAKAHVLDSRPLDNQGGKAVSIEDYGWGKGWQFVYEEFNKLLADVDLLASKHGLRVCLIAHDSTVQRPNPSGEDFLGYVPKLYNGDKNGRGSVRERVKNWADHVLFLSYDVSASGGKATGGGTRTIYTQELPTHVAKSRTYQGATPFDPSNAGDIWAKLGIVNTPASIS